MSTEPATRARGGGPSTPRPRAAPRHRPGRGAPPGRALPGAGPGLWRALPVVLAAVLLMQAPASAQGAALPVIRVGVVHDGPPPPGGALGLLGTGDALKRIRAEVEALTGREFDVRFPEDKRFDGGWDLAGIRSALERALADPEVDLVLALGLAASHDACLRGPLPKPVVAPFVIDVELQGTPLEGGASGVENLSYVTTSHSTLRDLRKFHELVGFETVHVIHDELIFELLPHVETFFQERVRDDGIRVARVPVTGDPGAALDALPAGAEAVYVTPLMRMPVGDLDRLVEGLNRRKLPTFALLGRTAVERGVLAGLEPGSYRTLLARRVALNVQRILLGEEAGTLPVYLQRAERLTINMDTARAIDWYPRWRVLTEAELLNEKISEIDERLSLEGAVREAVQANLELRATDRFVSAAAEEIRRARSGYKPRLDVASAGRQIDRDRAAASFGSTAERAWSGSATLSQILYSDAVRANVRVQERLQTSRERDRDRLRLDVALEAALGFLDVLRAQTLERIQKDNLRLTEANLESARRRQTIGVSGPSEVYRWEARLARDRREVVAANRRVDSARAVFNRVLNRDQEMLFVAEEPQLEDPNLVTGHGRLQPYVDNPKDFAVFREFEVEWGLESSPELQALEAAIAAQERALLAARRAFWSPELTLFGEFTEFLSEGGVGAEGPAIPLSFEPADDTDWQVGLLATLPLYAGGSRRAELRQSREELEQLRLERAAVAELVELRIRTSLFDVATTYPAIEFNREAAEAAGRNLDLVRDMYARGTADVIDLLDAQNAALSADQQAANSVFDFLIDLMKLQRAVGNFDFFISPGEREAWFDRLDAYYGEWGVDPGLPEEEP